MMPGLRDILDAATPGRWRVEQEDEHGTCVVVDMLGGWRLILAAYTAEADARLIALTPELAARCLETPEVIEGLLEIAEMAMPDSYFSTDSRLVAARALLARLNDLAPKEKDPV